MLVYNLEVCLSFYSHYSKMHFESLFVFYKLKHKLKTTFFEHKNQICTVLHTFVSAVSHVFCILCIILDETLPVSRLVCQSGAEEGAVEERGGGEEEKHS